MSGRKAYLVVSRRRHWDPLPGDPRFEKIVASLAAVYAKLGRPDDAFPILNRLVSAPSGFVIYAENLKHDPQWDRIRADPRFEKLVEEAKQPLAEKAPAK